MFEKTVECPICGQPYVMYPMYVGDQSACHKCRARARKRVENPSPEQQREWEHRRNAHFGTEGA